VVPKNLTKQKGGKMSHTQTKRLEVIAGCMYCGKTEELIRRLERLRIAKRPFLLFKPTIEDRYSKTEVVAHNGARMPAYLIEKGKETLEELKRIVGAQMLDEAIAIGFDEGNFFSLELTELCLQLRSLGKRVIIAGLDLTYDREPYGPMPYLMAHADRIDKFDAVCFKCGGVATLTQRLVDGKPAPKGERDIVGGKTAKSNETGQKTTYEAACQDCFQPPL